MLAALLLLPAIGRAAHFADLCADRIAIERVYYQHRLGNKPPFEQTFATRRYFFVATTSTAA